MIFLLTLVVVTTLVALALRLAGLRNLAVYYGAVIAAGALALLSIPEGWHAAAFTFVGALSVAGYVWYWFRSTRGGAKFPWNLTTARNVIALSMAASVNLLALPAEMTGQSAGLAFAKYLTAVIFILAIYFVPKGIEIARHIRAPKITNL